MRSMIRYILPVALVFAILLGRHWYLKPGLVQGAVAPPVEGELLDGSFFRLSDLEGRYVLIDFWGSWCPPCRAANPDLVSLHREFHDQGFDIVSVGVEKSTDNWRAAIEQDGLNWRYHLLDRVNNLRFFDSPLAAAYGVRQLPTSYLINPKGRIVGVNLSYVETHKRLQAGLGAE
jgi:thiol-disulfide isomerase/thioredoxin